MIPCVKFLLRGPSHSGDKYLFLIYSLLAKVCVNTLVASSYRSSRASCHHILIIIPIIASLANHDELTAARSNIDYLFHLLILFN